MSFKGYKIYFAGGHGVRAVNGPTHGWHFGIVNRFFSAACATANQEECFEFGYPFSGAA